MRQLVISAVMVGVGALLVTPSRAASPKVVVEIAFVVRTPAKPNGLTLEDELKVAVQESAATRKGVVALLKYWLPGQERKSVFVDLMNAAAPLGEEVTFEARQTIGADLDDAAPAGVFSIDPFRKGISVKLRGIETEDGTLQVSYAFKKDTLGEGDSWQEGPDTKKYHRVPLTRSLGISSTLSLEPKVPLIVSLGGGSSQNADGEEKTYEQVLVLRAVKIEPENEDDLAQEK